MAVRTIKVTQRDIDLARKHFGPAWCPIARAIKRAMRGTGYRGEDVQVLAHDYDEPRAWFEDYGVEPLPADAANFVYNFDGAGRVQPFAFTMWTPA